MKINQPCLNRETPMRDGTILVSQTDLKGKIVSCNQAFIDISGFDEGELIGASHNIVRHPFMPPILFKDMWDTIKAGKPWSGLVKNRSKDGCYYWVTANVTPLYRDGQPQGYMSVRTKPSRAEIDTAEALYQEINAASDPERFIRKPVSLLQRLGIRSFAARVMTVAGTAVATQVLMLLEHLGGLGWPVMLATLMLGSLATVFPLRRYLHDLQHTSDYIAGKLQAIGSGNYFDWTEVTRDDELGDMLSAVKMAQIKLGFDVINANETVLRIIGLNSDLDRVTTSFQKSATSLDESAASINEINNTVRNNSINTEDADSLAVSATSKAENSGMRLKEALEAMEKIRDASGEIAKIIRLIDEIAFKTKLLSINASVEAAHAGEQGKGFSVVADEVRSLAAHTANAANEIKRLIDDNQERIDRGEEKMRNSDEALHHVIDEVKRVSELLSEIASAGKEQSLGVENLANALQVINESIQDSTQLVTRTSDTSRKLGIQAEDVMKSSGMALA